MKNPRGMAVALKNTVFFFIKMIALGALPTISDFYRKCVACEQILESAIQSKMVCTQYRIHKQVVMISNIFVLQVNN